MILTGRAQDDTGAEGVGFGLTILWASTKRGKVVYRAGSPHRYAERPRLAEDYVVYPDDIKN